MGYYVTKDGRHNLTLFLVDRSLNKKHWWTASLITAMCFEKESAAQFSASRLRYGNPSVVSQKQAERIEQENDRIIPMIEEHPFSSEALGQE